MKIIRTSLVAILSSVLIVGCAPSGYHYDGFNQVPNDPCWDKAITSPGMIASLNNTVGKDNGLPVQIQSIRDANGVRGNLLSYYGFNVNAELICHATLVTVNGKLISGVFTVTDPGKYASLQITWISDIAIAKRRAERDRLRNNKNLLVKPDLDNPEIQECVGKATAMEENESYPGQLWMACADRLGLLKSKN
jgi:hypothetical protein